jgi:hypothetical protein
MTAIQENAANFKRGNDDEQTIFDEHDSHGGTGGYGGHSGDVLQLFRIRSGYRRRRRPGTGLRHNAAGCAWQISHAGSFFSYYGSRTGSGSGVAYLYATADRGAARTASVYVQQPYSYSCGLGTRNVQWCTGYSNAAGATAVQY